MCKLVSSVLFLTSATCSSAGQEAFDCIVNVLETFRIALKVSSSHLLFDKTSMLIFHFLNVIIC